MHQTAVSYYLERQICQKTNLLRLVWQENNWFDLILFIFCFTSTMANNCNVVNKDKIQNSMGESLSNVINLFII